MTLESDVFVVRDDKSRAGLRRVHLIRAGKPVEEEEAMRQYGVTDDAGKGDHTGSPLQARLAYEDEDTKMWHLRLYWREDGP